MTLHEAAKPAEAETVRHKPRRFLNRRFAVRAAVFLGLGYVAWCATLYLYQDRLLFPADLAPPPMPSLYDRATEELKLDLPGGGKVVAWFIPAQHALPGQAAPLVIYFHGNAEIIDYQSPTVEGYRKLGCALLLPEYRGYGRSDGRPSEQAIVADAIRFYDQVAARSDVDASRIVIHGRSLGGGPAAQLALRRKPRALILESTFCSVAEMAHGYAAPSFLAKHPFRTDHVLAALDVPVLIFHGARDDIIPVAHGRRLAGLARNAVYVEYDCRHNDFPGDGNEAAYWQAIAGFLRQKGIIEEAA